MRSLAGRTSSPREEQFPDCPRSKAREARRARRWKTASERTARRPAAAHVRRYERFPRRGASFLELHAARRRARFATIRVSPSRQPQRSVRQCPPYGQRPPPRNPFSAKAPRLVHAKNVFQPHAPRGSWARLFSVVVGASARASECARALPAEKPRRTRSSSLPSKQPF